MRDYHLAKFKDYDSLTATIEKYIYFYITSAGKKLDKLAPITYRQILENAA